MNTIAVIPKISQKKNIFFFIYHIQKMPGSIYTGGEKYAPKPTEEVPTMEKRFKPSKFPLNMQQLVVLVLIGMTAFSYKNLNRNGLVILSVAILILLLNQRKEAYCPACTLM
jgi:hypothetical protein